MWEIGKSGDMSLLLCKIDIRSTKYLLGDIFM